MVGVATSVLFEPAHLFFRGLAEVTATKAETKTTRLPGNILAKVQGIVDGVEVGGNVDLEDQEVDRIKMRTRG
jgi:hypothetical protein